MYIKKRFVLSFSMLVLTMFISQLTFADPGCSVNNEACLKSKMKLVVMDEFRILRHGRNAAESIQPMTLSSGEWISGSEYENRLRERGENIKRGGFFIKLLKLTIDDLFCSEGANETYECLIKVNANAEYVPLPPRQANSDVIDANENITHRFIFIDEDGDDKWEVRRHAPLSINNITSTHLAALPGDSNEPNGNENFARIYQTVDGLDKINSVKINIKEEFDQNTVAYAKSLQSTEASPFTLQAAANTYNRAAAVAYALAWVDPNSTLRNPSYPSFSNDCTNYTSQALEAGGWEQVSGWYQSDSSWWYNYFNQSYPWAGAENFWWHALTGNRAEQVSSFCELEPGDLISADWNGNLLVQHTMIVTKKIGCELFVSYHSNDRENKMFRELLDDPDANFWGWKITGNTN